MNLTDTLHDAFLSSGEILPPADIARIAQEFEFWNNIEHDNETLLRAIREAGERFVDSMVQNEHDTERVAKWEAMRPSTVRRLAILAIATSATA